MLDTARHLHTIYRMEATAQRPVGNEISLAWRDTLTEANLQGVVKLVDCATADGGTLGYANAMTPYQAAAFKEGLAANLQARETHALLGSVGDQYVFFCLMTPSGMPNCCHRAELAKGVVHPSYRGRNVMPRVFRAIVSKAESLGVEQLVLDVRDGSRAHLLWQRFGFESYGVLEDYARLGEHRFRGHYMAQNVASLKQRVSLST